MVYKENKEKVVKPDQYGGEYPKEMSDDAGQSNLADGKLTVFCFKMPPSIALVITAYALLVDRLEY